MARNHKTSRVIVAMTLLQMVCTAGAASAPWWDDFPRMVSDSSTTQAVVTVNHHAFINMNANAQDPGWGTFFQRDGIVKNTSKIKTLKDAGLRQIGYFETFGTSYCPVSELGSWDGTNLTPVLHTHWSWASYAGGTVRWLGAKNFFDDEDFARPYTRTHPRYGGPPMTYPGGIVAAGYSGDPDDPRNSRVYDAGCSKDIFGNLSVSYTDTAGPTNGLVINPVTSNYASFMMFKKDSACPVWAGYTYASTLQAADAGIDGMWSDNYGPWDSFGNPPVKLAFGDWSVALFRGFLTNHFTASKLTSLGITNAATFDIRAYLKQKAGEWGWDGVSLTSDVWSDSRWPNDQIWRAYTIFKRQAGTSALSNYYAAVKSAALSATNTDFMVSGNDIPGFSMGWCRGDLDMVSTEHSLGNRPAYGTKGISLPPAGCSAPSYKLAREHARSRFVNVWMYNDGHVNGLTNTAVCNVLYYEMLATHALPKFDPSNSRIVGTPAINTAFFGFVEQVAPVFENRMPVEDIGIYYSSSTLLRQFTPGGFLDMDDQPHQFAVWGWGTALQELHRQYRMVPEWKLTPETLGSLRLLIIPNAEVLSSSDVSGVLTPWLDGGGRLIITGSTGKFAGERTNFNAYAKVSIASLTNRADVVYLTNNIGRDYYLAYTNRPALLPQIGAVVSNALSGAAESILVGTTAPSTAGVTVYQDEAAGKLFIDVNNMNINTNSWLVASTGPLTVDVVLPAWMQGTPLQVSAVSPQTNPPPVGISPTVSNKVTVSLGSVDYYAGVIIANEWGIWREAHFTSEEIKTGIADEDQDPDADGYTNRQEYIAGSEPKDKQSVLRLQGGIAAGSPELSFGTVSGRWYSVYSRTSLVSGTWSLMGSNVYGTGGSFYVTDTGKWATVFYNLKAELP
jgi:hypothetical protein